MNVEARGAWEALPEDVAEWMGMPDATPAAPEAKPRWFSRLRRGGGAELPKAV